MRDAIRASTVTAALSAAVFLAGGASASAAFPGSNGRIAFAHDDDVGPGVQFDIFTMNPEGSDRVPLTSDPGNDLLPSYSADGERIVWVHRPQGASNRQIWVMNADGSGQTQLTSGVGASDNHPAFSPDGQQIVFDRGPTPGGDAQIWAMNADGSNPSQITFPGPGNIGSEEPSFSPDGRSIVFYRQAGPTSGFDIWVMNADGSGQTRLTTGDSANQNLGPDFSPDGMRIAYDHFTQNPSPNEDIFVMNANGSDQRQVTSGPGQDYAPSFAPDGTRVVFPRESQNFSYSDIVLANPNGLDLDITPITANQAPVYDSTPAWQPLNPPNCELSGAAKQKSVKSVSVTVSCSNENASVVAEGAGSAPKVPKAGAVASKKKKFTIPAVATQVQPGTPATVTLTIPKKGRKLLKKATRAGKKGRATITVTTTDDLGQSSAQSLEVKFKKKKKKK
jgi:Tol biopolymer transport system component